MDKFNEKEIAPGIFITDFRKKKSSNSSANPNQGSGGKLIFLIFVISFSISKISKN